VQDTILRENTGVFKKGTFPQGILFGQAYSKASLKK